MGPNSRRKLFIANCLTESTVPVKSPADFESNQSDAPSVNIAFIELHPAAAHVQKKLDELILPFLIKSRRSESAVPGVVRTQDRSSVLVPRN